MARGAEAPLPRGRLAAELASDLNGLAAALAGGAAVHLQLWQRERHDPFHPGMQRVPYGAVRVRGINAADASMDLGAACHREMVMHLPPYSNSCSDSFASRSPFRPWKCNCHGQVHLVHVYRKPAVAPQRLVMCHYDGC